MKGGIVNNGVRLIALDIITSDWTMRISGDIKCNKKYATSIIVDCFSHSRFLIAQEKINCIISGHLGSTLYIVSNFSGLINGNLILKMQLDEIDIPLNLILDIDSIHIHFPLMDNINCLIKGLNFYFDGNFNNYRMNLKFVVSCLDFLSSSLDVVINSHGGWNDVIISSLNIRSLKSSASVMGIVKWQEIVSWDIKLILNNINIVQYDFIRPINLWGEIDIHGCISDWTWKLESLNFFLYGKVFNRHCFDFRGDFVGDFFNEWSISECCLSIGSNILKINGDFKNDSSIVAIIECMSINEIFPDFHGSVSGSVVFSNFLGYYECFINIFSKCFQWKDNVLNIDHILIQGNLLYKNILEGSFECQLDNFIYNTFCISKLSLQIIGNIHNHVLVLSLYNNLFNISTETRGFFDTKCNSWNGNILKINIIKSRDSCYLNKTFSILYRNLPHQLIINSDCLKKCIFQISFYHTLHGNKVQRFIRCFHNVHLLIKQFYFIDFLGVDSRELIFLVDLSWDQKSGLLPFGTFHVLSSRVKRLYTTSVLQKKSMVAFADFDVNVSLSKECLLCDLSFKMGDHGQCNGKIKIYLSDSYPLFGNLYVNDISLFHFNVFLKPLNVVNGTLNFYLRFSGSLIYPEIYGNIKLENAILKYNSLPFVMLPSKVLLSITKSQAVLNGSIRTTRGTLYLTGNLHWNSFRSIYIYIRLVGDNIRLILSPTVQVNISPNIICEITPLKFNIKGVLNIPSGNIDIKENDFRNELVNISSDEYIVTHGVNNGICYNIRGKNIFLKKILGSVILRFGDNVRINSFGLDAKLNGNLEVIKDGHGLWLKGYMSILRGSINIYGQNLFVKKGQLLFSGLINHQPYLNIEAVYNSDFIQGSSFIDGIRITGFVPAPELEVFSDHLSSRESTISYIFCGQQLNYFNLNTNTTIKSILVRLGLFHAKKFVKQVGSILKVKDLMLNTFGIGDESQVILSGYIAPGLQIKYSIGIFDSLVTSMTTRYRVLPNLYLEVISGGQTQVYNVIYQFKY